MKTITQTLFTGWHLMRWVRLSFGIFFLIQAIQENNSILWLGAGFFLFTSLTNLGCCGGGTCAAPVQRTKNQETEEIQFEEVKKP